MIDFKRILKGIFFEEVNTALINTEYIFKQAISFCSEKLNETNERDKNYTLS